MSTACELAGDWWWVDKFYVRVKGGRALYEDATATPKGNVVLRRLRNKATGLAQVCRTVAHDQAMEMVKS